MGNDYEPIEGGLVIPFWKKKWFWGFSVFIVVALILTITLSVVLTKKDNKSKSTKTGNLAEDLSIDNIMLHLEQLQNIANEHGNSRTAKTGYNASVEYVYGVLSRDTNFLVSKQYFEILAFQENAPPQLTHVNTQRSYSSGVDFRNLRLGGNSNGVEGTVIDVQTGCTEEEWAGFEEGSIAFMERGTNNPYCPINTRIEMAENKSAAGLLMWWGGNGLFSSSNLDRQANIPAFSLTLDLGEEIQEFLQISNTTVFRMVSDNTVTVDGNENVFAETLEGDPTKVIVIGSHLDSVPAGPGINDNGSGSATNLALALLVHQLNLKIKQRIRFAWWGAEELGLLGSKYYVANLSPEDKENIVLNLNYDMLGSPNYMTGIYNGSGADVGIRKASEKIQAVHEEYLISKKHQYILTEFDGRSDYGPFIENGIPAGGLFSGAEKRKTTSDRSKFGGIANAAYDPCYHLYCDDYENINTEALNVMSRAAAYALEKLAMAENIDEFLQSSQLFIVI